MILLDSLNKLRKKKLRKKIKLSNKIKKKSIFFFKILIKKPYQIIKLLTYALSKTKKSSNKLKRS